MRHLTITRQKTFVGCAAALRVFIEDAEGGTTVINGTMCRLLGKIKNDETQTYEIDEESRRVFIIADKLSKNICNEFTRIPAGQEDVLLTGRPHFSLITGNAFRFDGVVDPEVLENRRKSKKKGAVVMLVALIVGFVIGFALNYEPAPNPKDFTYRGMTITLTEDFKSDTAEGDIDVAYISDYVGVHILLESITGYDELAGTTPVEYAKILLAANELDPNTEIKEEDGLTYFTFKEPLENGDVLRNYIYTYTNEDYCYAVIFYTFEENAAEYRDDMTAWAKSVTFGE